MQGTCAVVRVVADCPAGEGLYHCYGPQLGETVTAARQDLLQQQYRFRCRWGCGQPRPYRIQLVLFSMQNRTLGPCLAAIDRILISPAALLIPPPVGSDP
jgi:hypothetical protein